MIRFIFLILTTLPLVSCQNPAKSIEPDIEKFKTEHSDQFTEYKTIHRTMRFAWSGDPKKRPLIFVHGSPGSWQGWAAFLLNSELQKNFHIIAIDRPGYGGSGQQSESSLQIQASDIMQALQFNQSSEPALLVGHSYGGPVIARMAMDYPEKIAGLIFVASSVDPELEEIKWIQYPAMHWPIKYIIPNSLRVCNEEIMDLKPELQKLIPLWNSVKIKTIIIQGDKDDLVPKENLNFLVAHIDSKYVIEANLIPGLNHFIPWKRPELILDAIQKLSK